MKENGNWYDHLKPSNNAELGCYLGMAYLLVGGLLVYLQAFHAFEVAGLLFALVWVYWWAYTLAYRRHKRLEDISLSPSKLHLVASLLMLSGIAGYLLLNGISDLIALLEIPVISLVVGLASLVGFVFFLTRFNRLADFLLRYVSKE